MDDKLAKNNEIDLLKAIETRYPVETNEFIAFVEQHGGRFNRETIDSFIKDISGRKRIGPNGRVTSYSTSWYNQRITAIKHLVREALRRSPELGNGERYLIQSYLRDKLHLRKKKAGIGKEDRVPNADEVKQLIEAADTRLSLVIEFMAETGCRISEALSAEIGKARRGDRITYITITGKGGKQRDLRCRTDLYDRILLSFKGKNLLFEHSGKPYSRVATTNRIKDLSEKVIGKPVTAHMLRHYRGTQLSEKLGISKAASELGHSDISTTKKFYDHSRLSDDEFLDSL